MSIDPSCVIALWNVFLILFVAFLVLNTRRQQYISTALLRRQSYLVAVCVSYAFDVIGKNMASQF